MRLYERLPEAQLYHTYGYWVYGWPPSDRRQVGKGDAVNWNSVAMLVSSLALLLVDWPAKSYASLC